MTFPVFPLYNTHLIILIALIVAKVTVLTQKDVAPVDRHWFSSVPWSCDLHLEQHLEQQIGIKYAAT